MIRIVVVDDEEVDRYVVKRHLRRIDHDVDVVEFEAGDHFIEALQDPARRAQLLDGAAHPVLVLLDINMPRMDGFEVLASLTADPDLSRELLVVTMYSSSAHAHDQESATRSPYVAEFVVKPLSAERLGELIQRHVTAG